MTAAKRTQDEVVGEMTDIIVAHLETLPREEQKRRIAGFRRAIKGVKRAVNQRKNDRAFLHQI